MSTSAALEFIPTRGELIVVGAIMNYVQKRFGVQSNVAGNSQIGPDAAVDVLQRSDLPATVLANIWNIADENADGNLSERELSIAVRLMGWAQSGKPVNSTFVTYADGPLPTIKGIWEARSLSAPSSVQLPPVNAQQKLNFYTAFADAGPVNGYLGGERVRDVYIKSNLSYNELDRIWNLVDKDQKGSLTRTEFALGMYLIEALRTCQLATLPTSIPSYIYDQFSDESDPSFESTPTSQLSSSPLRWASPSISTQNMALNANQQLPEQWDVTLKEQAEANKYFDILDTGNRGYVDGDDSARFMLRFFKLPPNDIAHIWDLVDLRQDNKLVREQLAVAIHLIHQKLEGMEIPSLELPSSLIPPSLRSNHYSKSAPIQITLQHNPTSLSQKPLASPPTPLALEKRLSPQRPLTSLQQPPTTPQKPLPPPPLPSKRSSMVSSLKRPTSVPSLSVRSLQPPVPTPEIGPFSAVGSADDAMSSLASSPLIPSDSLNQETIEELRRETGQLKSQIKELVSQLKHPKHHGDREREWSKENNRLKARIQDMELSMSQVLRVSERVDNADELEREVARLTQQLTEQRHIEEDLRETLQSLAELTQENGSIKIKYEDLKIENRSIQRDLEEAYQKVDQLESEKATISSRMADMERLLADPKSGGSSRRELQILLRDVTRENEQLKKRERELQKSMSAILLTSENYAQVDELKRENSRLKLDIQEMETVIQELHRSSDDNILRRLINDLEQEKGDLNMTLSELQRQFEEVKTANNQRIEELERRCNDLNLENQRLRQGHHERDNPEADVPPPAYEETFVFV